MVYPDQRPVLLTLVAGLGFVASAQITNPPLDLIPPSYAKLCTTVNSDGSYSANPSACYSALTCAADPTRYGAYYCGGAGAPCQGALNCASTYVSNGAICLNGICAASYGLPPYYVPGGPPCVATLGVSPGDNPTCGGIGAACTNTDATPQFDALCTSGYCANSQCIARVDTIDGACGPTAACGATLYCDAMTSTCRTDLMRPSSRARARARERRNVSLCPGSHTACRVGDGFECIDTSSSIEQCGGCSGDANSVDCSTLEGVAAVGCVSGRCEVWACEDGYEFAPGKDRCVRG